MTAHDPGHLPNLQVSFPDEKFDLLRDLYKFEPVRKSQNLSDVGGFCHVSLPESVARHFDFGNSLTKLDQG